MLVIECAGVLDRLLHFVFVIGERLLIKRLVLISQIDCHYRIE